MITLADVTPSPTMILLVIGFMISSGAGLATIGLYFQGRKALQREKKNVQIADQPVEVSKAPKRFNAALAEQQHTELTRRLDGHDSEIDSIWNTLRAEDEATRKEMRDYVATTNLSLGRIEGKLGTLPKEK